METKKKTNFIRINHKNKLEYFSEEKLVEFKLNLYNKLTIIQDQDYTDNLNTFIVINILKCIIIYLNVLKNTLKNE